MVGFDTTMSTNSVFLLFSWLCALGVSFGLWGFILGSEKGQVYIKDELSLSL